MSIYFILFIIFIISGIFIFIGSNTLTILSDTTKVPKEQIDYIYDLILNTRVTAGIVCTIYYILTIMYIGFYMYKMKQYPPYANNLIFLGVIFGVLAYFLGLAVGEIDKILNDSSLNIEQKKSKFIERSSQLQIIGISICGVNLLLCILLFVYYIKK